MTHRFAQTWRVSDQFFLSEERFEELFRLLTHCPDTADEVAVFLAEPSSCAYQPLEEVEQHAALFERYAPRLRAAGMRVGINVWPSFGTGESFNTPEKRPENPFPRMVGADGSVDENLVCPNSPEFLHYIHEKFKRIAKAGPAFIWVDDDTRLTHLSGVKFPCFCPRCVQGFEGGRFAGRAELIAALEDPQAQQLRRSWSAYGGQRLARFCAEVRRAVDEVDPAIDTPFMTVGPTHTTFSGDFIPGCMEALRSRRGRPGHGFYWDGTPDEMLGKCMEAGRQVMRYPARLEHILYEEESCPCVHLDKSFQTRRNEVSLALAAGCTGVAFNHAVVNPGIDRRLAREVEELHACRPRWESYVRFADGLPWGGLWPAFSWTMAADRPLEGSWFAGEGGATYSIARPEGLGRVGLPLTAAPDAACATLLAGKMLRCFSEKELEKIFSGNVWMDVFALQELEKLGMAELAGACSGSPHPCTQEVLTAHPFNGPFAGHRHNGLFQPAYDLLPQEGAQQLAFAQDPYGRRYGCCLTLWENALGGKVAVSGYDCWRFIGDPHKLWQFAAIARWMDAPLTLRWPDPLQPSRLQPFVRTDGRRAAILLVNASLDASNPVQLLLRGTASSAVLLTDGGAEMPLPAAREGEHLCIDVGSIPAWETLTVLAE